MKKLTKKKLQKKQIIILAEDATSKIIKNRLIISQIDNYNKQIEVIKLFMKKCSKNKKIIDNNNSKNSVNNLFII